MDGHRDQLAVKELHQLAVGKIVGLDDGHLVPATDEGAHGQEQCALGAGSQNQLAGRVHRGAAKLGELLGQIGADIALAAVLGVGLVAASHHIALHKLLQAAGDGLVCVHVAVGEVYGGAGDGSALHGQSLLLLQGLLAGSVVTAQL